MRRTIPLWLVFTLQSLVVLVSFIAVILVLVLQQQDQFKSSVFREIHLQQQRSEYAIMSPLIAREDRFKQLERQVKNSPEMWYADHMNQSSDAVRRFFNFTYYLCNDDPIIYTAFMHVGHSTLTHADGTRMYGALAMGANPALLTVFPPWTESEMTTAYVQSDFPMLYDTPITYHVPVSREPWSLSMRKKLTSGWGRGGVSPNPILGTFTVVAGLTAPLIINTTTQEATLSFSYGFNVSYMVSTVQGALLSPDSKLLLYDGVSDLIMTTRNTGYADINTDLFDVWTLTTFPDQAFIERFRTYSEDRCRPANNCTYFAEEVGDDIISLMYMTTEYGYKLHLFQITPRSYYFAAGEKSAVIGIVIGVVAAVVVLVSCVVIWFAVRGPVRRLRESMELAAVMRNDEVSDTSSVLTELDLLSQSFTQMNDKLLQARAFMPQSMLVRSEGDDEVHSDHAGEDGTREGPTGDAQPVDTNASFTDTGSAVSSFHGGSLSPSSRSRRRVTKRGIVILSEITNLVRKKVAVLMINARGTHTLATNGGEVLLESEQVRLVELVERCARAEKGVVDAFQGDHFVLTFNAVRAVGSPGRNGALVGLSVEEGAQRDGLALGRFSMGLSVGRAHVGNVGSATMKKNCTVGGVYTNAAGLERLAKRVGRTCVVNGRCLNDLEHAVYFMLLGSVQLSSDTRDVAGCVMSRVEGAAGDQEWLYQMEGKADPFREYNELVETYLNQGVEAAAAGVEGLGARVDDPDGGFVPGAIPHLLALLDRRRRIATMGAEELGALHVGGRHPFDADFDMRSA